MKPRPSVGCHCRASPPHRSSMSSGNSKKKKEKEKRTHPHHGPLPLEVNSGWGSEYTRSISHHKPFSHSAGAGIAQGRKCIRNSHQIHYCHDVILLHGEYAFPGMDAHGALLISITVKQNAPSISTLQLHWLVEV